MYVLHSTMVLLSQSLCFFIIASPLQLHVLTCSVIMNHHLNGSVVHEMLLSISNNHCN